MNEDCGHHTYRKLSCEDLEEFYNANLDRQPLFGGRNSTIRRPQISKQHLLEKLKSKSEVWGLFDGKRIIASLSSYPWESLPYYSMYDFFIVKDRPIKFYDAANILFQNAISSMEMQGRMTFYVVTRLRPIQVAELKSGIEMKKIVRSIKPFERYNVYLEAIINPNETSSYVVHRRLLNNNSWDCHVLIRKGELMQQFRQEKFRNRF